MAAATTIIALVIAVTAPVVVAAAASRITKKDGSPFLLRSGLFPVVMGKLDPGHSGTLDGAHIFSNSAYDHRKPEIDILPLLWTAEVVIDSWRTHGAYLRSYLPGCLPCCRLNEQKDTDLQKCKIS